MAESESTTVRAQYIAAMEQADRRAEMFSAVMTALEAALRGYDGTHPSHPHDRAVWLERILEAARAVVQRAQQPKSDESRSPDGDGQQVASSRGLFKGLASPVSVDAEQRAGQQAWEPEGVQTTSSNRDSKGAADAQYGASKPGVIPDEARQKATGPLPKSTDALVVAGSEPADSQPPTLDERVSALESNDPNPADWPVKAGC